MDVKIHQSWKSVLEGEFNNDYFIKLVDFVKEAYRTRKVYPPPKLIFNAFEKTPFDKVKVVILGQDPYHGPNQAMGLSFSVPSGVPIPPSLANIYREIESDLGRHSITNGDLTLWAEQGVLLLNSVLTVEAGKAGSHRGKGWEIFTDAVIEQISRIKKNVVFILWGSYAQSKVKLIRSTDHLIITSPHPSPLSANRGFFGSRPFSRTNEYLKNIGHPEIIW